jgi:hypothetical protein
MRSLGRLSPRATFVDGARRGSVDERGHEELHVSPDPAFINAGGYAAYGKDRRQE